MRQYIFTALFIFSAIFPAHAQEKKEVRSKPDHRNELKNEEFIPACYTRTQLVQRMTPDVLSKALNLCLKEKKLGQAKLIYAMLNVYGLFDTYRVVDKSTHAASTNLISEAFSDIDEKTTTRFREEIIENMKDPDFRLDICRNLLDIGGPQYVPYYMIGTKANPYKAVYRAMDKWMAWTVALNEGQQCPTIDLPHPKLQQ